MTITGEIGKQQGRATTTNNTPTDLNGNFDFSGYPDESRVSFTFEVTGKDEDNDHEIVIRKAALIKLNGTSVSLVGSVVGMLSDISTFPLLGGQPQATFVVDGTIVSMRVTGLSGKTIGWFGEIRWMVN